MEVYHHAVDMVCACPANVIAMKHMKVKHVRFSEKMPKRATKIAAAMAFAKMAGVSVLKDLLVSGVRLKLMLQRSWH